MRVYMHTSTRPISHTDARTQTHTFTNTVRIHARDRIHHGCMCVHEKKTTNTHKQHIYYIYKKKCRPYYGVPTFSLSSITLGLSMDLFVILPYEYDVHPWREHVATCRPYTAGMGDIVSRYFVDIHVALLVIISYTIRP